MLIKCSRKWVPGLDASNNLKIANGVTHLKAEYFILKVELRTTLEIVCCRLQILKINVQ